MNPAVMFVIMLGIGLPLTFVRSVTLNVIVIAVSLSYLLIRRVRLKTILIMLLAALPLAFGSYISQRFYATHDQVHMAWVYATRIIAYLTLGATLTLPDSVERILFNLADHLHFSETFVYGLLSSFNMIHTIRVQWRRIRYSALIRGEKYSIARPGLYLRIIVVALNLSNDLAQAMTSQGFSEGFRRTHCQKDALPAWQWVLAVVLIVSCIYAAVFLKLW